LYIPVLDQHNQDDQDEREE